MRATARRTLMLPGRRGSRWGRIVAVCSVVACLCAVAFVPPAGADPAHPTARDVQRARSAAAAKADAVGRAQARLALADARLRHLQEQTTAAIAAFNAAQAKLAAAQQQAARATLALQAAQRQVAQQRLAIASLAAATYRSGGELGMWNTLLSADGPASFLESAGAVTAISARQASALGRFRAARVTQQLAQQEAAAALATVQSATADAKSKKDAAEQAVSDKQREVGEIAAQKAILGQQAQAADSYAHRVKRQYDVNLAKAKAAAAAAAERRRLGQGQVGEENPTAVTDSPRPPATAAQGREALDYAKQQLGKPYEWGADGPGTYDCSGLTMMSWRTAGISIDHYSVAQYGEGEHVSRTNLRAGDLVFFAYDTSDASTIHHVGIYAGNGMMINAPHTGANVRYDPAFRSDYIGATRP